MELLTVIITVSQCKRAEKQFHVYCASKAARPGLVVYELLLWDLLVTTKDLIRELNVISEICVNSIE